MEGEPLQLQSLAGPAKGVKQEGILEHGKACLAPEPQGRCVNHAYLSRSDNKD